MTFFTPGRNFDEITAALTGFALPLDVDRATQAVETALKARDAQLIGGNCRGHHPDLAGGPDMKFRMIPFRYFDAYLNMALDEAIMEAVRNGESLPTIRFLRLGTICGFDWGLSRHPQ